MMRTEMKSSFIVSDRSTKTANTEPFPRRQKAILRNNNKKPQFHLLHCKYMQSKGSGSAFENLPFDRKYRFLAISWLLIFLCISFEK